METFFFPGVVFFPGLTPCLVEVDASEKATLDAHVSFLAKYHGCDKGEQKLKMLEAFANDKTCKTW